MFDMLGLRLKNEFYYYRCLQVGVSADKSNLTPAMVSLKNQMYDSRWYSFDLIEDKKELAGPDRPLHRHVYKMRKAVAARRTLLVIIINHFRSLDSYRDRIGSTVPIYR